MKIPVRRNGSTRSGGKSFRSVGITLYNPETESSASSLRVKGFKKKKNKKYYIYSGRISQKRQAHGRFKLKIDRADLDF